MGHVIVKAAAFVFIIFLGYGLKKKGFFQPRDFQLLSKIILHITIPAVIVVGFSQIPGDSSLMALILFGAAANLLLSAVGILAARKKGKDEQAFNMLNFSGFNIGCFTLPYVQSFLGPVGIVSTLLFDAGNSFLCTGGTYALAGSLLEGRGKGRVRAFLRRIFSSPPILTFIVMLTLFFFRVPIPEQAVTFAGFIAGANAFLAMLMIGIGLELRFQADQRLRIARTLALRYAITVPMALAFFFLTPFALEVRQALVLVSFAPVSAVAVAFTGKFDGDVGLAGAINSASILVSIAVTSVLLTVMGIG